MPRRHLAAFLAQYGLSPRIKWSCTNLHTVVQAVQAGMGISVLSPVLMREELAAGTLREIPVEDFAEVREISAAVRRGPERLRTAGTVFGFLPGTIRPALSISFYQNKADKHRNPGSVRGFLYVVTKLKICRKIHQKSIAFRL